VVTLEIPITLWRVKALAIVPSLVILINVELLITIPQAALLQTISSMIINASLMTLLAEPITQLQNLV
jgi:hypothetical protein